MARPENARRRVSHLVGRFEQLAKPDIRNSDPSPGPASPRPASHHGDKPWVAHDRRSFSLSALPSPVDTRSQPPRQPARKRHRDLSFAFPLVSSPLEDTASVYQDAYEGPSSPQTPLAGEQRTPQRVQPQETSSSSHNLRKRLEDESDARQTLQVQCAGLQTQVDRLSDKLAQRDEVLYQHYELRLVALATERDRLGDKVEKLRQKLVKRTEEQRAEYSRRITAVSNERDVMTSRVKALESAAATPDSSAGEKLRVAEAKAEESARKVQALQTQLQMLKVDVAKETKTAPQTSDQDIASMMSALNHQLQNWVVNVFRGIKIDATTLLQKFDRTPALSSSRVLRRVFENFDTSTKFFAFQATILGLLHRRIFAPFFFGLPVGLRSLESAAEVLTDDPAASEWRSRTYAFLLETRTSALETSTAEAQSSLAAELASVISGLTDVHLSPTQSQTLRPILGSAVALARLLGCQRAAYAVVIPGSDADADDTGLSFESATMEDVYGEAGEKVKCVTFPLLLKHGDERGENPHIRNVISKAKVLCYPDD